MSRRYQIFERCCGLLAEFDVFLYVDNLPKSSTYLMIVQTFATDIIFFYAQNQESITSKYKITEYFRRAEALQNIYHISSAASF